MNEPAAEDHGPVISPQRGKAASGEEIPGLQHFCNGQEMGVFVGHKIHASCGKMPDEENGECCQ